MSKKRKLFISLSLIFTMIFGTCGGASAATDYSKSANNGFEINSSSNKAPYWYSKRQEKHLAKGEIAYYAQVYVGYTTHKGTVKKSGKSYYHDDIMCKVEILPQSFSSNNKIGVKTKYKGYPEYYSVTHSITNTISEYSPDNAITKSASYSVNANASATGIGVQATVSGIEKKSLEVTATKENSDKSVKFAYNYVAGKANLKTGSLFNYCSSSTKQLHTVTTQRTKDLNYNDSVTTYGTAGYSCGIYIYNSGKSGGSTGWYAINM